MAKKFFAINRSTGKRWVPDNKYDKQYLVMYDSGYLAVVTHDFYTYISPLDPAEWETIKK